MPGSWLQPASARHTTQARAHRRGVGPALSPPAAQAKLLLVEDAWEGGQGRLTVLEQAPPPPPTPPPPTAPAAAAPAPAPAPGAPSAERQGSVGDQQGSSSSTLPGDAAPASGNGKGSGARAQPPGSSGAPGPSSSASWAPAKDLSPLPPQGSSLSAGEGPTEGGGRLNLNTLGPARTAHNTMNTTPVFLLCCNILARLLAPVCSKVPWSKL